MKNIILTIAILSSFNLFGQQSTEPEMNVIYGDKHIFTIETPTGWINDKQAASTIDLISFFYSKADSDKKRKSYMYAMGYDKDSSDENLNTFVMADLKTFHDKYPNLTYEQINVGATGGIINATMLSFDNLDDRYKEEVIYMETEYSILVFSFAAFNEQDYKAYRPIFDQFATSFNYRGNNPKSFLEWQKSQN